MKSFTKLNQSIKDTNLPQTRATHQFGIKQQERGAVLIVVLVMLILVALAGAIAVKQSATDLKTATADQINTLLLQSADGANGSLESTVNGSPQDQGYKDLLHGGMLWFFLMDDRSAGSEYMYCYNTESEKYLLKKATVRQKGGTGNLYDNGGACDYTKAIDYINERQTSMVQVNVTTTPISVDEEALRHYTEGKAVNTAEARKAILDVYSTSLIPSYAEPKNCLSTTALDTGTVTTKGGQLLSCLRQNNTPTKMLFQNIEVENASSSTTCKPFGQGAMVDDSKTNKICTIATSSTP